MKKIINTQNAPSPIGPYTQAVLINDLLFTSGQIAIDVKTNELISENIKDETMKVMENLQEILTSAEMNFSNVVKTTIYLSNMDSFLEVNDVYSKFFRDSSTAPARETVEVARLPKNANVEISMIAVRNSDPTQ